MDQQFTWILNSGPKLNFYGKTNNWSFHNVDIAQLRNQDACKWKYNRLSFNKLVWNDRQGVDYSQLQFSSKIDGGVRDRPLNHQYLPFEASQSSFGKPYKYQLVTI